MAIAVDGAFLLRTEDRAEALTDLLFIGVVLVVMTMLLVRRSTGRSGWCALSSGRPRSTR
jgi:hypothetical protein